MLQEKGLMGNFHILREMGIVVKYRYYFNIVFITPVIVFVLSLSLFRTVFLEIYYFYILSLLD